jgi:hypothetical protein
MRIHSAKTAAAVAIAALLCGCGTSPGGGSGAGPAQATATATPTVAEVPRFASELGRVCADGLGFSGLPAYKRASKAVRPAVLMTKNDDTWSQSTPIDGDYPRGWILGYTDKVKNVQSVVCYERTGASAAGKVCAMQDTKTKKPMRVTMYNTTYRLRVLEARTGKPLYQYKGRARSTTCPMFTYTVSGHDRTKYYTEARAADYRGRIKRFLGAGT